MEINKEVTVKITVPELEQIIKDYLKTKGVDVKSVYFDVNEHNREGDWRAELSTISRLDEVICKGVDILPKSI